MAKEKSIWITHLDAARILKMPIAEVVACCESMTPPAFMGYSSSANFDGECQLIYHVSRERIEELAKQRHAEANLVLPGFEVAPEKTDAR